MKLIIQTGLVDHQKADAKCCFKLLEQIPDKDQYFIITTGLTDGPICISGIHGYSFKNIKAPRMFRLFFSFFFSPDINVLLLHKIFKYVSNNFVFDTIYCFSGDYLTQILGSRLKKRFPNVIMKTILYDPMPTNNYVYKRKLNLLYPKKTVVKMIKNSVDYVYCTSGLFDDYKSDFLHVEICGLPLLTMKEDKDFEKKDKNTFTFLYAGSINTKVRTLSLLINHFKKIGEKINYKIIFAGVFSKQIIRKLSCINAEFVGYCDEEKLKKLYDISDALILIGNNNSYQTPSKLIEYISYRKKIISFESLTNSQSRVLLKDYVNSFIIDDKDCSINAFLSFIKQNFIDQKSIEKVFYEHTPKYNYELIFS